MLNRSGHLGGLARREASITMADIYLRPPIANFGLMAYGKGEEIAAICYEYTMEKMTEWKLSQQQ